MIRHIVLIRFRPEVTEATILAIFADLCALVGQVPGLIDLQAGRSASPEDIERGYMHGFTADFTDAAALAAYGTHPAHVRAAAEIEENAVDGREGVLVLDLPFAANAARVGEDVAGEVA